VWSVNIKVKIKDQDNKHDQTRKQALESIRKALHTFKYSGDPNTGRIDLQFSNFWAAIFFF
jgi:hypothetical protein